MVRERERQHQPVEAVLFDLIGVVARQTGLDRWLAAVPAHQRPEVMACFLGPRDTDTDHPRHRLERGELTLDEAFGLIEAQACRSALPMPPLTDLLRASHIVADPAGVAAVRAARAAGCRTSLVTNNTHELDHLWRPQLPLDELFDDVVASCDVGVRKPDPAIFAVALRRLGDVAPERVAFLDDVPAYVDAAARLGIEGILVGPDPAPALARLQARLATSRPPVRPR